MVLYERRQHKSYIHIIRRRSWRGALKKVTFALKMLQLKTKEVNCLKSYNQLTLQLNLELWSYSL